MTPKYPAPQPDTPVARTRAMSTVTFVVAVLLLLLVVSMAASRTARADRARLLLSGALEPNTRRDYQLLIGRMDRQLTVNGDGRSDLDCYLFDAGGAIVAEDADDTDYCTLSTLSLGRHRLVVRNKGAARDAFVVTVR